MASRLNRTATLAPASPGSDRIAAAELAPGASASRRATLEDRFTLRETRSAAPPRTSKATKICPECRTVSDGRFRRCTACACDLSLEPHQSTASSERLLPYLFFGVAVATLLVLAAIFYR